MEEQNERRNKVVAAVRVKNREWIIWKSIERIKKEEGCVIRLKSGRMDGKDIEKKVTKRMNEKIEM